jgi:hypothetical protein
MAQVHESGRPVSRVRSGARCLVAVLLALTAACRAPPPARAPSGAPARAARPAGATEYRVDAKGSQLWLYVHAAGPMVKLGHSHVISTHALRGSAWIPAQIDHSTCEFELPVAAFEIDNPEERSAAGGEFAEPLDEAARAGTREHMLGDRQLDATHYPLLTLLCQQVSVSPDGLLLQLAVSVRDHDARLAVPVHWQRDGCTLQASGEFTFRQSDLGIEPYNLLLGVLRVDDEIRARFQLLLQCRPVPTGQGLSTGP